MPRKLNSYWGTLKPKQIAEGINIANRNAERLLTDAKILLKAGRFPSALSLSVLSIEESGKASVLRWLAISKPGKELSKCWKCYRTHVEKNYLGTFPQKFIEGSRKLDDFRSMFDKQSDEPFLLDQIKQIGFYTDCLGKAHWSVPNKVINKELAESLISVAEVLTSRSKVTTREIELWIKHLYVIDTLDFHRQKEALLLFYKDMQSEGLLPQGYTIKDIVDYLGLDPGLAKD